MEHSIDWNVASRLFYDTHHGLSLSLSLSKRESLFEDDDDKIELVAIYSGFTDGSPNGRGAFVASPNHYYEYKQHHKLHNAIKSFWFHYCLSAIAQQLFWIFHHCLPKKSFWFIIAYPQ